MIEPLKFLHEREVVHFQRFGEALRIVDDYLNSQKQFAVKMPGNLSPKENAMDARIMRQHDNVMDTNIMKPNESVLDTKIRDMKKTK